MRQVYRPQHRSIKLTDRSSTARRKLQLPTLGGLQFWTDYLICGGWRIQQHSGNRKFRLLNEKQVRVAEGEFEDCRQELKRIEESESRPPVSGAVVLVLHGLIRTRRSMKRICRYINSNSDFTVVNIGYASTRRPIKDHAAALASIITHLEHATEFSFVAHSMGNIVVRHYLADFQQSTDQPGFGRMVMLGPPNHGSQLAATFDDWYIYRALFGQGGQELAGEWEQFCKNLAVPEFPFGIIAGGRAESRKVKNPLIRKNHDWVVSVRETYLEQASEFLVLPVVHTTMMYKKSVQQATLNFLKYGKFHAS